MRPEGLPCRTLRSTRWRGRAIRSGERLPAPPPRRPLLPCSVATLALLLPAVAQAQQAPTGNPSAWSILEQDLLILFRILVVATVIERLLEYLGLAWEVIAKGLERLLQNRPWLRRISPGPLPTDLAKIRKQLILQSIGVLLGVTLCWRAHLGIFAQLEDAASGQLGFTVTNWFVGHAGTWLDYAITGILVGLGTEPIHSIIMYLLRRRDLRKARIASAG